MFRVHPMDFRRKIKQPQALRCSFNRMARYIDPGVRTRVRSEQLGMAAHPDSDFENLCRSEFFKVNEGIERNVFPWHIFPGG